jgi:hypothetical protein
MIHFKRRSYKAPFVYYCSTAIREGEFLILSGSSAYKVINVVDGTGALLRKKRFYEKILYVIQSFIKRLMKLII